MEKYLRNQNFTLALIIIAGFILRLIMFSGYIGGDDIAYLAQSYSLVEGNLTPPETHWGTRTLPVLLTYFSISVLGINDLAITFFPMIVSIFSIYVAYLLGEQVHDKYTGYLSALLVAVFPMEVTFASQLFPYVFLSAFSAFCLFLFLRGEQDESSSLLFYSGLVLGLAYMSRITAVYCLLFFGLYLLWKRRFNHRYLYFILGFTAIVALESIYYFILTGDYFHRFYVLAGKQLAPVDAVNQVVSLSGYLEGFSIKWLLEPFFRPIIEQEIGFTFLILWPIALFFLFKKDRTVLLLLLWIVPLFLYINYGSTSPFRYFPLRRLPRYLSIIVIPSMVLIAYYLQITSRRWRNLLVALIMVSSVLSLILDNSPNVTDRERDIARYIVSNPDKQFLLSRSLFFGVNYFLEFKDRKNISLFAIPKHEKDQPIFLLRIDQNLLWEKTLSCGARLIVKESELQSQLRTDQRFVKEKIFARPTGIYEYLLSSDWVLKMISLVRDDRRASTLLNRKNDNIYSGVVVCN